MQTASSKTRAIVIGLVALLGFTGIGVAIGHWAIPYFMDRSSHQNIEKLLTDTAEAINKKSPMSMDPETRLDGTQTANREFRYRYTLINHDASAINAADIYRSTWQKLLNKLCTSDDMKTFRDNDVTVMYSYFGRDARQITTLSASPSQCKH